MKKCEVNGCENSTYESEKKCILHCQKDNYLNSDAKFYEQFLQELTKYIATYLFNKFQKSELSYVQHPEFDKQSVNIPGLKAALFSDPIPLELKSN